MLKRWELYNFIKKILINNIIKLLYLKKKLNYILNFINFIYFRFAIFFFIFKFIIIRNKIKFATDIIKMFIEIMNLI